MMHVKRNKEMEIKKEKPAAEKRTSERRHRETKKGLTVASLMKNPAIQTIFWFIVCLLEKGSGICPGKRFTGLGTGESFQLQKSVDRIKI